MTATPSSTATTTTTTAITATSTTTTTAAAQAAALSTQIPCIDAQRPHTHSREAALTAPDGEREGTETVSGSVQVPPPGIHSLLLTTKHHYRAHSGSVVIVIIDNGNGNDIYKLHTKHCPQFYPHPHPTPTHPLPSTHTYILPTATGHTSPQLEAVRLQAAQCVQVR